MNTITSKKIALVTGGNSGIGYATAKLLAQLGYIVHIAGRDKKKVNQVCKELKIQGHIVDLSKLQEVKKLSEYFIDEGLDLLVNSAGIAQPLPIENYTLDNFNSHIDINLKAPLMLIHYLLTALERRQGSIVNISSIITRKSNSSGFSIYAATKGALEAATRSLAKELASRKIRINAICPGAIDTPMFDKFGLTQVQIEQSKKSVLNTIPLGRMGKPEEIAQVIVSQAQASYVTGAIWHVDGGVDT
jgi:NAD(P)-dependent dehydrogenase (short-subunit alcohol dehydrogenase family)